MLTFSLRVAPEELDDTQDEEHVPVEALHCNLLEGAVCIKWIYPASAAIVSQHSSMQTFRGYQDT